MFVFVCGGMCVCVVFGMCVVCVHIILSVFAEPTNMLDIRAVLWLEDYLQVQRVWVCVGVCTCP